MQRNINFIPNKNSDILYVVLSGISGGKDEPLVQYITNSLKKRGAVASTQFANDPLYHDDALVEMEETTFDDYFNRIDATLQVANREKTYTNVVFIAHSFSAVIVTYYLGLHKQAEDLSATHYTLIAIDSDSSEEALKYLDSLSEKDFRDKTMNPFHLDILKYMREHSSTNVLKTSGVPTANIDAREIDSDHNFTSDKSKRVLMERILSKLPTN